MECHFRLEISKWIKCKFFFVFVLIFWVDYNWFINLLFMFVPTYCTKESVIKQTLTTVLTYDLFLIFSVVVNFDKHYHLETA